MRGLDLSKFYGRVPLNSKGINIGRIDRRKLADLFGWEVPDILRAYLNWQTIFRFVDSTLTFRQYLDKLVEAGIKPFDVGNGHGKYNLARINDEGPYTERSCRFITRLANIREQKKLFGGKPTKNRHKFPKGNKAATGRWINNGLVERKTRRRKLESGWQYGRLS